MMHLDFTSHIFKEGDMFVAYAPEFDVSSCGDTPDVAKKNLLEALELFLESAQDRGVLNDILVEAGFSRRDQNEWEAPELISLEKNTVTV